jgi:H+/Cl- antiporter ClcA
MVRMNVVETGFVGTNAIFLAIFYTIFGAVLSYVMYHLFNEFDDEWKQKTLLFQLGDVGLEVSILASVALWSTEIIKIAPSFLPVRKELDLLVDNYISGIFFIFAVFVFMDQLTEKLKYLFARILGPTFNKIFPQYGSIIDLSLSYSPRKTDKDNYTR